MNKINIYSREGRNLMLEGMLALLLVASFSIFLTKANIELRRYVQNSCDTLFCACFSDQLYTDNLPYPDDLWIIRAYKTAMEGLFMNN